MEDKYLVMVNPDYNNNKYYRMSDNGDGTWTATYGRVGDDESRLYGKRQKTYPAYMWAIKYQEKIMKGYEDLSELHSGTAHNVRVSGKYAPESDKDVQALVDYLSKCSRQFIEMNYTVTAEQVTRRMLDEGKKYLKEASEADSVEDFNKSLIQLFHAIPRRMGSVLSYLASTKNDFDSIIQRETDTLSVMESQVMAIPETGDPTKETILSHYGIEVYVANEKQTEEVKRHMKNPEMQKKIRKIYRVINKRTQDKLNAYSKEHNAKIRMFWHGSRNENWMSLLIRGLILNANATTTGKMWGNGTYLADKAGKSWGYTSSRDAKWTSENSPICFMGLCAAAYGNPFFPTDRYEFYSGYSWNDFHQKHPDKDCVHVKAGVCNLLHDEVIFYREDQVTINYIVEFNAA